MKTQNFGQCYRLSPSLLKRPDSLVALIPLRANALKDYRENRENGEPIDNPKKPFPSAGFDTLEVRNAPQKPNGFFGASYWPDKQFRYWWTLTLNDGRVIEDFYWMADLVRGYPDKSNETRYWFTIHHAPSGTKIEGFSSEPDHHKGFPDKNGNYWRYIQFTDTHCPAIRQWMEEKDFNYLKRIRVENPALFIQELTELKRANPKHPAISTLETSLTKEEKEAKDRLAQQQPQPQAYLPQQQAYPPQQQAYPPQQQAYPPQQQAYPPQQQAYPPQQQAYPPQQQAYPPQQQAYPLQQQLQQPPQQQLEKQFKQQLVIQQQSLVIQQQSPERPTTSDLSKQEGKQKATSQPSLNDETIKQLALSIEYKEIKIIRNYSPNFDQN